MFDPDQATDIGVRYADVTDFPGDVMATSRPILIDLVPHQREALSAVKSALTESHGSAFALEFIRLHRSAIYSAARKRVCGRSEDFTFKEAQRLAAESGVV
jgi:hypothetical protein